VAEAWKFLKYLTTAPDGKVTAAQSSASSSQTASQIFDPASAYLEKTKKPAARRDLAQIQQTDPVLGVFAKQNLLAKSWKQNDPNLIESIMAEMIDKVNSGSLTVDDAIKAASVRINQQGIK
jgi:hypothetical protein